MKLIRDFVPLTVQQRSTARRCLPRDVRPAILNKRKAWRRWKKEPSVNTKKAYNASSRKCSEAVRHHAALEEESVLNMSSHRFYNYVTRRLHPMTNSIVLANNSCSLVDPQAIAGCFLRSFQKILRVQLIILCCQPTMMLH